MATNDNFKTCPYCKEQIKSDAVKCKHCKSKLTPERPSHDGICPYCKEEIKKDAIKCKHCQSILMDNKTDECNCREDLKESTYFMRMASPTLGGLSPGFNSELCDWNCLWDSVECRKMHSDVYCNERLKWCYLFCKAGWPSRTYIP